MYRILVIKNIHEVVSYIYVREKVYRNTEKQLWETA
jgi:hypothetical protein